MSDELAPQEEPIEVISADDGEAEEDDATLGEGTGEFIDGESDG